MRAWEERIFKFSEVNFQQTSNSVNVFPVVQTCQRVTTWRQELVKTPRRNSPCKDNEGLVSVRTTIGDKSVEKIVENRTTSRKSVVRVKFQAPSSPIQCWMKSSSQEQHCIVWLTVLTRCLPTFKLNIRVLWIFSRGSVPDCSVGLRRWTSYTLGFFFLRLSTISRGWTLDSFAVIRFPWR